MVRGECGDCVQRACEWLDGVFRGTMRYYVLRRPHHGTSAGSITVAQGSSSEEPDSPWLLGSGFQKLVLRRLREQSPLTFSLGEATSHTARWTCLACLISPQIATFCLASNRSAGQHSMAPSIEFYLLMIFERYYFQISPTLRDHRGHRRTVFPIRVISLQACALAPLGGLRVEPCTCNRARPGRTV